MNLIFFIKGVKGFYTLIGADLGKAGKSVKQ